METTTEMLSMSGSVLFKNDLQTGEVSEHDFGVNRHLGEFVFVSKTDRPRKNDKVLEDDGWLMGFVIDSVAEVTDLVILGAQDISAAPLARIRIPHTVPPGFHGNWV
jgi:carotenoid cleavage dioxygenase